MATTVLGSAYKQLADTSRYLWNSLPDTGCTTRTRDRINHWAASTFLFSLNSNNQQLQLERGYYQQFWGEERIPELYIDNQKIKNLYHVPQDKPYEIDLPHGKVTWTCSVIRSKGGSEKSEKVYNLVYIAGKDCTKDSTYAPIYPYLNDLVKKPEDVQLERPEDVQYNVILITGFDISHNKKRYIPKTIDETGFLLQNVLCQISKEMGGIDQVIAHSLGGIMFGASLLSYKGPDLEHFPKRVFFDRCPGSLYGAAKNVPFGLIGYGVASLTGDWALDLGKTIADFEKAHSGFLTEKDISFVIGDTLGDHYFSKTWLGLTDAIKNCTRERFATMQFRIPHGGLNPMAQHALPASFYYGGRVVTGNLTFLKFNETLAEGIIRHSRKERKKEQ